MEETFYQMLERTGAVDRLLFWCAVLGPPAVAIAAALLRHRPVVERYRHRWVLAMLAAPGFLVLWKVYNSVTDHFGLESLTGLFVNVGVFAAAALAVTGLRLGLKALLTGPPLRTRPAAPMAIPSQEFRPYKAGSTAVDFRSIPMEEKPASSPGDDA